MLPSRRPLRRGRRRRGPLGRGRGAQRHRRPPAARGAPSPVVPRTASPRSGTTAPARATSPSPSRAVGRGAGPPHRDAETAGFGRWDGFGYDLLPPPRCPPAPAARGRDVGPRPRRDRRRRPATPRPSRTSRAPTSGGRPTARGAWSPTSTSRAPTSAAARPASPSCSPRRAWRSSPPTSRPGRDAGPINPVPDRQGHPAPVRLIVVRVLAVLFALTWLVLPGFGLIDLSVTWDPDWPVVLEASWGVHMGAGGGGFSRVRPAPPASPPPPPPRRPPGTRCSSRPRRGWSERLLPGHRAHASSPPHC